MYHLLPLREFVPIKVTKKCYRKRRHAVVGARYAVLLANIAYANVLVHVHVGSDVEIKSCLHVALNHRRC